MANEEIKNEVADVKKQENRVSDPSLGTFGSSDNFTLAWQQAQMLSRSSIVPDNFRGKPENILIAIDQANRLNVSPFMVMQNLYVIQGRPAWSSKFLIAMINGSGKFDEELHFDLKNDQEGKPFSCLAWTMKNGRKVEGVTVDMDMAKAEGWLAKNGSKWKTIPTLMLRYRAASFFASLNCPELTLGIYTQEEFEDNDFIERPADVRVEAEQEIAAEANAVEFEEDVADVEIKEIFG